MVYRYGHVNETDLGYGDDPNDYGWWCVHENVLKFFLRRRILEVQPISSPCDYDMDDTP